MFFCLKGGWLVVFEIIYFDRTIYCDLKMNNPNMSNTTMISRDIAILLLTVHELWMFFQMCFAIHQPMTIWVLRLFYAHFSMLTTSWYWDKTNFSGILSGAGFFHQPYATHKNMEPQMGSCLSPKFCSRFTCFSWGCTVITTSSSHCHIPVILTPFEAPRS